MIAGLGRRARSAEEMGINMMALMQGERPNYRTWAPPPDDAPRDVFITSWGKSGTTMMQQMFHQLRMIAATGADDMDFDDISRMTPWEDTALMLDIDMTAPQRAEPRGFKSHREYERLPPGQRYVVTLRDPKECYVSFHRFFDGWHIETGALSLEEFWPLFIGGGPGGCDYFTHLLSWWKRRDAADSLIASYHWAAKNRRAMIDRLARMLGLPLDSHQVDMVEEMTSREFMHRRKDRFDDAMFCVLMEERLGIPADSDSTKVQERGSDAAQLPPSIAAKIDAIWAERITPVTGHADFASLAADIDVMTG